VVYFEMDGKAIGLGKFEFDVYYTKQGNTNMLQPLIFTNVSPWIGLLKAKFLNL